MMRHFVLLTLYVQIFLCIFTIKSEANTVKGLLPGASILRRFLEQIIQPYARTYQNNNISTFVKRSHVETLIEKAIEDKIKELEPFLQDNDDKHDSGDKLTLKGTDETTIVEYVPKSHTRNITENENKVKDFQDNIEKYKKMRKKIERLLYQDTIADDTKVLVTKTLDDMIAQLIENQCKWKNIDLGKKLFKSPKNDTPHKELSSKEWQEVKKHYTNLIENKDIRKSLLFLHQSIDFFSKISKYYNVQCRFVDEGRPDHLERRHSKTMNCDNFQICSKELRKFLNQFYKSLNDSAVSTFRNYAEMYTRDVNTDDSREKEKIINVIKNISSFIELKANKVFRRELINLKLDPKKNKEANIKILNRFVTDTVQHIMKHAKRYLKPDSNSIGANKISIVKEDLIVNFNMDMGNLERVYIGKICKVFAVCNDNYYINGINTRRVLHTVDDKNIYVKVQVTLDDELKDKLASRFIKLKQQYDKSSYEQDFQITRTTHDYT